MVHPVGFVRTSPLFSLRRALFTYGLALLFVTVDASFVHLLGASAPAEIAAETLVHGTGFYLGFTVLALFGADVRL